MPEPLAADLPVGLPPHACNCQTSEKQGQDSGWGPAVSLGRLHSEFCEKVAGAREAVAERT